MDNFRIRRRDLLWGLASLSGSLITNRFLLKPANAVVKVRINGVGASFPAPLYRRWFLEYQKIDKTVQVNYKSIDSEAGVKQFIEETVDFGASDVAMTDDEIAKVARGVVLLPVTAGAGVVAYNIPSFDLRLSRQQLVDIFLGKIKNWTQVGGPSMEMKVIHRSDGSGTTALFTQYLSAISQEWRDKVGTGKTVQWPTGVAAEGSEGVTNLLRPVQGTISYVGHTNAKIHKLSMAQLQNKAGKYIRPTLDSVQTALSQVKLPSNLRAFIVDPSGDDSYPMVNYSWILAYEKYPSADVAKNLKKVLTWCVNDGQKWSPQLGYFPLPSSIVSQVTKAINSIS